MAEWAETRGCLAAVDLRAPHVVRRLHPLAAAAGVGDGRAHRPRCTSASRPRCSRSTTRSASPRTWPSSTSSATADCRTRSGSATGPRSSRCTASTGSGAAPSSRRSCSCSSRRRPVSRSSTTVVASTSRRRRSRPGGPMVMWGGGSIAAAKRAGRYGLGFFAQSDLAGMQEAYEESCREHGHEPGMTQLPPPDAPTTVFVADDVDKAWDEIGEYILHDVKMYGDWNPGDETTASISHAQTVEELRATSPAHKIYSTEEAIEMVKAGAAAHADAAVRWHPARDRVALPRARRRRGPARARADVGGVDRTVPGHERSRRPRRRAARRRRGARRRVHPAGDGRGHPRRGRRRRRRRRSRACAPSTRRCRRSSARTPSTSPRSRRCRRRSPTR